MGNRGERAAYMAAVGRYLRSELGRSAPRTIAARLLNLPEAVTGPVAAPDELADSDVHRLRVHLEYFARNYPISHRVFVARAR